MKTIKFSHLALTTLAVLSLVACQKGQTTSSVVEKPKQEVTKQATGTEVKKTEVKKEQTGQTVSNNKQEEVASQPEVTVQESKEPAQVPLEPVLDQSAPVQEESVAVQQPAVEQGVSAVSPGVVEGVWTNRTGEVYHFNSAGFVEGTPLYLTSYEEQANGVIHFNMVIPGVGGQYVHYYPAGVPLVFNLVSDDEEGNQIIESGDYTDSSRERLFIGTGGYGFLREYLDSYLNGNIYYR